MSKATNVSTSIELHKGSVANSDPKRGLLFDRSLCSGGLQILMTFYLLFWSSVYVIMKKYLAHVQSVDTV